MAGMAFSVEAKFEELLKLKKEIEETKKTIKEFYEAGDKSSAKKMEDSLKAQQREHEKLQKSLSPVIYEYQQLEKAGKKTYDELAKSSKATELSEQLEIQRNIVKNLEEQYKSYKSTLDKLNVGGNVSKGQLEQYRVAKKIFVETKSELDAEKKALENLRKQLIKEEEALDKVNNKQTSYITQMRNIRDEMTRLVAEGNQNTQQYRDLQVELEKVGTAYKVVGQEQKNLTSSASQLAGIASGISGVAGAFSAAQGVTALFTKDNEKLAAIQTKLQAAMAITIGLQQVSATLHQTSAFRLNTLVKATQLWNNAIKTLNTQLCISNKLSKVLVASGIGVVIAAVTTLISVYKRWKDEQEEINRIQKEFKAVEIEAAKAMVEQSVKVKTLISVADNYNNSLKSRHEALRQIKEIMPEYNGYIDKEGKLIANTDVALKNYLTTLYKVEKAKKIMSDIGKIQGQIEEAKIVGPGELTNSEKFVTSIVGKFSKERAEEMKKEYLDVKEIENEGLIRSLRSAEDEQNKKLEDLLNDDSVFKSLFGDKKYEKEVEKEAEKQKKAQEKISEEMRKMTERNISDRIALMDEGTQKELAQIEDKYNKTIAEIKKQEEEWKKAQKGELTFEQDAIIHVATMNAESERTKDKKGVTKALIDQYKDFAAQRLDIEMKFNKDIEALQTERIKAEATGNSELVDQLNRAIAEATKNRGKELISFDFDLLKKSPEYVRAFEDLKNTSTETLGSLLSQLEQMKGEAAETLDPTELREYTNTIQQIIDELVARDPFKALTDSQKKLAKTMESLATAKRKLEEAEKSGDVDAVAAAQKEYNKALDESVKASNDAIKAQSEVSATMNSLYDAISGVGDAMGGTTGQIISFIGDIGKFVSLAAEGITKTSDTAAKAILAIQNAVAILVIIQAAIQLLQQLDALFADSHKKYEKYAAKLREINLLTEAMNEYKMAVLQAKQAEENWFATDSLKSLRDSYEYSQKALENYYAKANELQAEYVNETGSGWLTRAAKYITPIVQGSVGDIGGGIATYLGLDKIDDYAENAIKAVDNLRIETRKASKGFLGSGIGGKSQRTENLVDWVRNQGLGELFDDDGMLNKELAETVLEKYGEKLVGETKETLEYLVEMQGEYESYMEQLQEYVSSLYEPLVDNFVDSLWDWFDNGKNALDSFKEYASDTFRDIVTDMMKTIVLKNVVGSFSDDIADLYTEYAKGLISEDALMNQVSQLTSDLIGRYEDQLPALQEIMEVLTGSLKNAGIDVKQPGDTSDNTLKGALAKASQESIDLLAGQMGAFRVAVEDIRRIMLENESGLREEYYASFQNALNVIRDIQVSGLNEMIAIREISGRVEGLTGEIRDLNNRIADSNEVIRDNTGSAVEGINTLVTTGVKLKGSGLGV